MVDEIILFDESQPKRFQFIAGELCLDYCNTMGGKRGVIPREKLQSFADFVSWCEQAGVIDKSQAAALNEKAKRSPAEAVLVLTRARELREAIYRVFLAIIEGTRPSSEDLGLLNGELAMSMGRLRIEPDQSACGFSWRWAQEPLELDNALGPVAHSAATLLASHHELAHVRQCRGDNCGWLFIDSSKNHSRCWCDMRDCGNRAKVRRHRQRHRSTI